MNDNFQIPNGEKQVPSVLRWLNIAYIPSKEVLEEYLVQQSLKLITLEQVTGQKVASELN